MSTHVSAGAGVHVIVPVKRLSAAKSRLAPGMGAGPRRSIVLAMLDDTLRALASSSSVGALTVITPDEDAALRAEQCGAVALSEDEILREAAVDEETEGPASALNRVLASTAAAVRERNAPAQVAVVQADLPSLRADEFTGAFSAALAAASRNDVQENAGVSGRAFVADRAGSGTTTLFACGAGTALRPRFGSASAHAHAAGGATPLKGAWPGLRHDVDTVADLHLAWRMGVGPATAAVLAELGGADGNSA